MNYIDIIICVPVAWGLYKGFRKGLIVEVATLFSLLGAVWVAVNCSDFISRMIREKLHWNNTYVPVIAFVVLFIGVLAGVYALAKLIERSVDAAALGPVNKILGALFGAFKFALILSVLFFLIDAVEKSIPVFTSEKKTSSLLYKPVAAIAPLVIPGLKGSRMVEQTKITLQ
ncbi:MAG TPA: CvpA family protein [Bacteroidia bacterium]|jgi:membrane protein required for colicin V production|nr:CvpA family protein [Bacteroidia bacterium]